MIFTQWSTCRFLGCGRPAFAETVGLCADHYMTEILEPLETQYKEVHQIWIRACESEHQLKPVWACSCGLVGMTWLERDAHLTKEGVPHEPLKATPRAVHKDAKSHENPFADIEEIG